MPIFGTRTERLCIGSINLIPHTISYITRHWIDAQDAVLENDTEHLLKILRSIRNSIDKDGCKYRMIVNIVQMLKDK